jgi:dUTP pyrophosphatase
MGAKHNIHRLAGVIDANYRGEWMVSLINLSKKPYTIFEGDKIIQAIIQRDEQLDFVLGELDETSRGEQGFGSSGR